MSAFVKKACNGTTKKVHRVHKTLGMNLRHRHKRRLPEQVISLLEQPECINRSRFMDSMNEVLTSGTRIRTLNLMVDFKREAPAIEVDTSLPAAN